LDGIIGVVPLLSLGYAVGFRGGEGSRVLAPQAFLYPPTKLHVDGLDIGGDRT
jgi:hypothetical protein